MASASFSSLTRTSSRLARANSSNFDFLEEEGREEEGTDRVSRALISAMSAIGLPVFKSAIV